MKKTLSLIIAVCALFTLVSCGGKKAYEADAKSFSSKGMTIELTEAFEETSMEGYSVVYNSNEVAVYIIKEPFEVFEETENMSFEKYTEFLLESNKDKSPTQVSKENGFASMEYSYKNDETDKNYKYFTAIFEGPDAYWCVQFVCEENVSEEYMPYFINWAKTVTFAPKA